MGEGQHQSRLMQRKQHCTIAGRRAEDCPPYQPFQFLTDGLSNRAGLAGLNGDWLREFQRGQ
jgi:hypothetical protein